MPASYIFTGQGNQRFGVVLRHIVQFWHSHENKEHTVLEFVNGETTVVMTDLEAIARLLNDQAKK